QARLAEEARKADELRKQQARDSIRSLPCPPNQVKNSEGDCVDCPPGFIVSNGECIRNCGANQRLAQNGIDCECLPGFEKNAKGDCLPKQCPPGYEFNAALDCVPECPPGRRRNVAGDCEELNCPPGQHRDAAGNCVPKCNTNLVYNPKNGQCEPLTCDKPWMKRDPASGNCVPKSCDDKRQIRDSAGNCNCPPPWSLTNCSVCAEGMTGSKTIQGRDTCVPTNRGCEEGYVRSTIRDKDGKYNCIPKDYEYAFIKLYQIEAKTENVTKFNDFEEEIEPLLENALGIEKFDKAKFKHHDDGEGNLKYELRFDRFDEVTALLQKIQSGLDALYEKKYFLIKGMRYIPVPQIVPIKK
ncbi:MAG: hypothetical protein LC116_01420, partial [Bacteroidetes bacterium]|nr:hypothetical protein [Bacteroidota bacterium]